MPWVIDTNTALVTSCQLLISLVEKTHKVDKNIDMIPNSNGICLSGILLFFIPSPIKYNTGIRISNSGLIKLNTSSIMITPFIVVFRLWFTVCNKKRYSISWASCMHIIHHYRFIVKNICSSFDRFYILHKTCVPHLVILHIEYVTRLWYNEINQNRKGVLL